MKSKNKINKVDSGLSLVEILIVVTVFAVLGIIISSSLILTMQGAKKSESLIRIRENLNYSLAVIERNIRNANSIVDCAGNTDNTRITFIDQNGATSYFSCVNTNGVDSYISSGSARLTSDTIKITSCSFACSQPDESDQPFVLVNVTAQDASASGKINSTVSTESKIYFRN